MVLLLRLFGVALPAAVAPTLVHATGMLYTFLPMYMFGFFFTAGPAWLAVKGPAAPALLPTALLAFAGKARVGMVSNVGRRALAAALNRFDFAPWLSPVVSRDEVTYMKPKAEGILRLLSDWQLAAGDVLFVGDSRADVFGARAAGMDALNRKTALLELCRLVFHQGNQRTDHQRGPAARDARQLVTKRLAGPRGHDQQDVLPFDGRTANSFLVRTEGGKPKRTAQKFIKIVSWHGCGPTW